MTSSVKIKSWSWSWSWRKVLAGLGLIVAIGGSAFGLGWAVREIIVPLDVDDSVEPTYATVAAGEVGSVITLGASMEWSRDPIPVNQISGVLTTLPATPFQAVEGDELYTVDLRPVTLGFGRIPMYRDLTVGVEGRDVKQIQRMLGRLGYYPGDAHGAMDSWTKSAVQLWQTDLGVEDDGIVRTGDVVFVDDHDRKVQLALVPDRRVGDQLVGGEDLFTRMSDAPRVSLTVSEAQQVLVREGMRVALSKPNGGRLTGKIGRAIPDEKQGGARIDIVANGGGPICGTKCDQFLDGNTLLADVYQIEPVRGLTVPVTAIRSNGANEAFLDRRNGTVMKVKVLASANGIAVVEGSGLKAGDQVAIGLGNE